MRNVTSVEAAARVVVKTAQLPSTVVLTVADLMQLFAAASYPGWSLGQ